MTETDKKIVRMFMKNPLASIIWLLDELHYMRQEKYRLLEQLTKEKDNGTIRTKTITDK